MLCACVCVYVHVHVHGLFGLFGLCVGFFLGGVGVGGTERAHSFCPPPFRPDVFATM